MCLIVLAWRVHPEFPLIVAANRDEFHARPAAPAAFWEDQPAILAGRDLEARGTWMGVSRSRQVRRGHQLPRRQGAARGGIPRRPGFAGSSATAQGPASTSRASKQACTAASTCWRRDGEELWWMSNRDGEPRRLEPGIYGLGNTLLDAPEVDGIKKAFAAELVPAPAVETPVRRAGDGARSSIPSTARAARPSCSAASARATPSAASRPTAPPAKPCTTSSRAWDDPFIVAGGTGLSRLKRPSRDAGSPYSRLHEAMRAVERHRMHLRREHDFAIAARLRALDQLLQHEAADAAVAPLLQHRHAADVAVGQQAAGADRLAVLEGDGVNRRWRPARRARSRAARPALRRTR